MGIKVAKFGGSSVADALQIGKIKRIIENDSDIKYVVVSAPGKRFKDDSKITDLLYLCKTHIDHKIPYEQIFQVIHDRFISMEVDLGVNVNIADDLKEIKNEIENGASADYIASRGEYLNAKLIAAYLGFAFVDAKNIIRFSDKGKILEDVTNDSINRVLTESGPAVIPGFYGEKLDGTIKTFSRGGSDITGAIISRAVGAEVYENWTDVSGFMVADPRIVENPKSIDIITYRELRELSYMGASVLHESAIFPVRKEGIPINIRNTNAPEDKGTMIVETTCNRPDCIITGVAGKKGFVSISIDKDMMNSEIGFGRKVLQVFEDNGISFEHMPSGIDTMTVFVHQDEFVEKEQKVLAELHRAVSPDSIDLESDLALIAVVGRGMKNNSGIAANIFSALAKAKINIKMIDQGSSELNIIIGVRNRYFEDAIKTIYGVFIPESK